MIYFVIPTYNESKNLKHLVSGIDKTFAGKLYRILIVDDNSPDGTARIAEKLAKHYPIEVLHRPEKQGLGSAYIAGFRSVLKSKPDLIFSMDADFSHDPASLPAFLEASKIYHVVVGSRYISGGKIKNWSLYRAFISKCANSLTRMLLHLSPRDVTSMYRCYRLEVLKSVDFSKISSSGYFFCEELLWHCAHKGFTIGEVPITYMQRKHGKSKLDWKEIAASFWMLIRLRFILKSMSKK